MPTAHMYTDMRTPSFHAREGVQLPDTTHPRTGGLRYGGDVGTGHMQIMVTDLPAVWPRCTRDTDPFNIHLSWRGLRSDKYPDDYAGQPNSAYTGSQHAGPRAG